MRLMCVMDARGGRGMGGGKYTGSHLPRGRASGGGAAHPLHPGRRCARRPQPGSTPSLRPHPPRLTAFLPLALWACRLPAFSPFPLPVSVHGSLPACLPLLLFLHACLPALSPSRLPASFPVCLPPRVVSFPRARLTSFVSSCMPANQGQPI